MAMPAIPRPIKVVPNSNRCQILDFWGISALVFNSASTGFGSDSAIETSFFSVLKAI